MTSGMRVLQTPSVLPVHKHVVVQYMNKFIRDMQV